MKRSVIQLVVIIGFIIVSAQSLKATHYMGGEITWECIPTGQTNAGKFIFYLKVFRECYTSGGNASATFGTTITLNSNS